MDEESLREFKRDARIKHKGERLREELKKEQIAE